MDSEINSILIFGTGDGCSKLEKILKKDIEVDAYIDNDVNKIGQFRKGKKIISPSQIINYSFKHIIIASQYYKEIAEQLKALNIPEHKIIKLYFYFNYFLYNNPFEFEEKYKNFNNTIKQEKYENIITGLSYADVGIIQQLLKVPSFNFALGSQDLYFDYEILKKILTENINVKALKYAIITLSYYSFQYDMSKSCLSDLTIRYYNILKTIHNNDIKNLFDITEENEIFLNLSQELFVENFKYIIDNNITMINEEIGKVRAITDSNKNYPVTVKENIQIFKDYLDLLRLYKIEPIIVICPVTMYYYKYFSEKLIDEFYSIILSFKEKYKFELYDYFKSEAFDLSDFRDVAHLNEKGAKKFTKLLNNQIKWS